MSDRKRLASGKRKDAKFGFDDACERAFTATKNRGPAFPPGIPAMEGVTWPAFENGARFPGFQIPTSAPELSSQAPADAAASSTSAAPASSTFPSARLEVPREQVAQSQPVILPECPPRGRLESWVAQLRRVPDQVLRHRAPGAAAVERAEQHEHRVEMASRPWTAPQPADRARGIVDYMDDVERNEYEELAARMHALEMRVQQAQVREAASRPVPSSTTGRTAEIGRAHV